jgi:hypothetical protein
MDTAPTFRGRNIFEIRVPRSGIRHSFDLEWQVAAQWAGYRFEEFVKLPTDQQARHIAAYRCEQQERAVVAQAQAKESRDKARASKQTSARRPRKR